jgi:hypothetical protein
VLGTVIPVFGHLLPQIELASLLVHHRMVNLANESHLRRFPWEMLKCYSELELCVLKETVPNEENPVPD